jgi:enoyl-[acyl-carrier protein] reductase I
MSFSMEGRTAVVFGVANKRSIAWGIAQGLHAAGAKLIITYQNERLELEAKDLILSLPGAEAYRCDVAQDNDIDNLFAELRAKHGKLHTLVHSIGFAPADAMKGEFLDTTREGFRIAHDISVYSLIALARAAAPLMEDGGSILTLTYYGAEKVVPHYNVMGVAKAALEASVRYLAADFGPQGVRVNAISAGPVRTLAGAAIGDARAMFAFQQKHSPLGRGVTLDELGGSALYLLSDLAGGVTGEIHYVDSGYNIVLQPRPENMGPE